MSKIIVGLRKRFYLTRILVPFGSTDLYHFGSQMYRSFCSLPLRQLISNHIVAYYSIYAVIMYSASMGKYYTIVTKFTIAFNNKEIDAALYLKRFFILIL